MNHEITDSEYKQDRRRRRRKAASSFSQQHAVPFMLIFLILSAHGAPKDKTLVKSTSKKAHAASLNASTTISTNTSATILGSTSSTAVTSTKSTPTAEVLQIWETEFWDGSGWRAVSRWTDASGQSTPSPDKQRLPRSKKWVDDWKIVTGNSRDDFGWEYINSKPMPTRKRLWLRSMQVTTKKKMSSRRSRAMPRWVQYLVDDFNFKGFGWSFYKSLIFRDSCGVAIRLPLTVNFGTWERHPMLPSVSSSACIYNPPCAVVSLSSSMRLEVIKWLASNLFQTIVYIAVALVWLFVRGMALTMSAMLYPLTRKLYTPNMPMKWPWNKPGPEYNRLVEERLGVSFSWRVSKARGYEFRTSYWHHYAPQLTSLYPAGPAWWARRSAAIGLSTSAPIRDPPWIASSVLMSLSGFNFKKHKTMFVKQARKKKPKTTVSAHNLLELNATKAETILAVQKEEEEVLSKLNK